MKIVCLNGGLGNQLFQVCFAIYLKQRGSETVWVDTSHLISLTGQALKRQLEFEPGFFGLTSTSVGKLVWRLPRSIQGRVVHAFDDPSDWSVESISPKSLFIMGDFQHKELVDEVSDRIIPQLRQLVIEPKVRRPFVAVHLRLGDYLAPKVGAKHGVTDPNWSLETAMAVSEELGIERRVICTDSPNIFASMVDKHLLKYFEIDPSRSPWEVLGTLSMAEGLVMANSSLSWWGARLRMAGTRHSVPIVHPSPWMSTPSELDSSLFDERVTVCPRPILSQDT